MVIEWILAIIDWIKSFFWEIQMLDYLVHFSEPFYWLSFLLKEDWPRQS